MLWKAAMRPPPSHVATAIPALLLAVSGAHADPGRCRDAIIRESARFFQATTRAVAACRLRGVPDCEDDPRTTAVLARAVGRLRATLVLGCCGADGRCGTVDDDPLAAIGWSAGFCPNLGRADCNNLVADAEDIRTCVACVARAAVDAVAALTPPATGPPGSSGRCPAAIGRESARFVVAQSRALARCWRARNDGRHANACPDPGDGRATPVIAKAAARATAAICAACGGADHACGGTDDVMPATLGFASTCPDVTVPDGPSCASPVATLADVTACVGCVSTFDATCFGRLTALALVAYPPECAAPPGTCAPGVECQSGADCPAGYACLDNGSGATRHCVGPACATGGDCDGGAVCLPYCTVAGCDPPRCQCPGFACGPGELCIDDAGLSCRRLCTQDSDCPPPLGVCVNSTFGAGLCIGSSPCQ